VCFYRKSTVADNRWLQPVFIFSFFKVGDSLRFSLKGHPTLLKHRVSESLAQRKTPD
jgi:hypothetical protein